MVGGILAIAMGAVSRMWESEDPWAEGPGRGRSADDEYRRIAQKKYLIR